MHLTTEQMHAVQSGQPVRIATPELGVDCVVMRADVYERVAAVLDDALDEHGVAALVDQTMHEYDSDDPLLDSYQKYRS